MSQDSFAQELGMPSRTYQYLEANENAKISPETIETLARLGCNLKWLFFGEGEPMSTEDEEIFEDEAAPPSPPVGSDWIALPDSRPLTAEERAKLEGVLIGLRAARGAVQD